MVDGGTIEVYFPPKSRPGFYTDISSYYNLVRLINLVGGGRCLQSKKHRSVSTASAPP